SLPLRRCAVITTVSAETRRALIEQFPFAADKTVVVRNCVLKEFQASERPFNSARPRVLQIGTASNKNLENVIEALGGEKCTLHVVGKLSKAQARLLSEYQVAFENSVDLDDEQLLQAYVEADIVTFVSKSEGFGLPILEAQAVGRALITS